MDFINKQGRGARTKSKVILHGLSLNNITFIDKFILQTVPVCDPYAYKSSIRQGKCRPKEQDSYGSYSGFGFW